MKKKLLSPKEKLLKSLEVRMNNLKKKRISFDDAWAESDKQISDELALIEIQLKALKK